MAGVVFHRRRHVSHRREAQSSDGRILGLVRELVRQARFEAALQRQKVRVWRHGARPRLGRTASLSRGIRRRAANRPSREVSR